MAVFRIEKTQDYTVMCNYHLKDRHLSLKAKGLLSMMLSLPNDWDYTTRGLARISLEGVDAIGRTLKELETAGYLVRVRLRDGRGRIADNEYTIYEKPQRPCQSAPEPALPEPDYPDTENPYMDNPDMGGPDADNPYPEKPAQLNTQVLNKQEINTQEASTQSVGLPAPESPAAGPDGRADGTTPMLTVHAEDVDALRAEARERIEYDRLVTPENAGQLDELVEIMLEVELTRAAAVKIGRDAEYPAAYVRDRFRRLTSEHVTRVLDSLCENTGRVRNTKAYLLAALFNAPCEMRNGYAMQVNHDLYGCCEG